MFILLRTLLRRIERLDKEWSIEGERESWSCQLLMYAHFKTHEITTFRVLVL